MFPSLLRIQNAFSQLRNSAGISSELFSVLEDLDTVERPTASVPPEARELSSFEPHVRLSDVSITYPGASRLALIDVSFEIEPWQSVVIVGPSGAGKSTLVDVMLGVARPTVGQVQLSGKSPQVALAQWPGAVAYVPQDVAILTGSVRENVALGVSAAETRDDLVWEALDRTHLSEVLERL